MQDFVALDVETANQWRPSICSIAAVRFERGQVIDQLATLVDPQVAFSSFNTSLHGIGARDVAGAPTFAEVLGPLCEFVGGRVVVHHSQFDRAAIRQAAAAAGLASPHWHWVDSLEIARRAWPELSRQRGGDGHGLANICRMLGHRFDHHDALADARACGIVVLAAAQQLPHIDLATQTRRRPQFTRRAAARPKPTKRPPLRKKGALAGEVVVFADALAIPQQQAVKVATALGASAEPRITERTTIVVVANRAPRGAKYQRAQNLIAAGRAITILTESEFRTYGRPGRDKWD